MSLTVRVDGEAVGGTPNTIFAAWFNDYHDLLTGAMSDQPITLKSSVIIKGFSSNPTAPSAVLASGTTLGIGAYQYVVTYVDGNSGETGAGASVSITTTSGNQKVNLTAIPTGPTGTTARNIYRTKVGASVYFLLHTLADNTTTTYTDTTADASLGTTVAPAHSTMGSLQVENSSSQPTVQLFNDGMVQVTTAATSGVPSSYDALVFLAGQGSSYQANIGLGDNNFAQGAGLYAFDSKNSGFIFYAATKSGITFNGNVTAPGFNGAYGTIRNGTLTYVSLYTGGNSPTGNGTTTPATGALWAKA